MLVDEQIDLDESILDDEPVCEDDHYVSGGKAPGCTIIARARLHYKCSNTVRLACKPISEYIIKMRVVCGDCYRPGCLTVDWF